MNDYHMHVAADGEEEFSSARIALFVEQARQAGLAEIGISEHHELFSRIDWSQLEPFLTSPSPLVKIGLEIGYEPGLVPAIEAMIAARSYDYIIGSLHYIDGWAFDHPDYRHMFEERDVDQVYRRYYKLMEMLVASGLFDLVGHMDVVKKWGHRYSSTLEYRDLLERFLTQVSLSGVAVEINSAGLRKPVAELYPAPEIIEMMFRFDIPICFGSDAHCPEDVGKGLDTAARIARQAGYRKMVSFSKRKKSLVDIL